MQLLPLRYSLRLTLAFSLTDHSPLHQFYNLQYIWLSPRRGESHPAHHCPISHESLHQASGDILNTGIFAQGIYPTGVLVLVSLEKTIWDSRGSVVGYIDGNTTHLEFAPGPGIVSKNIASRHQIGTIQLDTEMQAVEFDRDAYMDSIESEV